MGQGVSVAVPSGPGAIESAEVSDLIFEKSLGGARFLRTIRARHQHGIVVVKLCLKSHPGVSFRKYVKSLRHERQRLKDVPNALSYQRLIETNSVGVLVRQYIHTSLYDRISIRPFLEGIEKKWIAFQLLCAVRDCHLQGVYHGDIKSENVLVTSWGWVYLTDFAASFKPVYLPEDNPADFSYFYDTSARRTCYLAPERFLPPGQRPGEDGVVQWSMDIFSLGCVIAELFTETPTFTLSQLFKYRKGEYDPTVPLLSKVDDDHVRALIRSMIRLDPEERWHAEDYLDEYKTKVFPLYFHQHFHTLMLEITDPSSGRKPVTVSETNNGVPDDRIERIYNDFEPLSISLGYEMAKPAQSEAVLRPGEMKGLFPMQMDLPNERHPANPTLSTPGDNGTFILLNAITASMRSVARASSKVHACELLLAFAARLPDEAKIDRILPYVMPLLEDTNEMVLVAALRTMTQLLAMVKVISPVNSFLFTQYIFPKLQNFVVTKGFRTNPIVRATYAACLASLAETASRFLDAMQALRAEGWLPSASKDAENDFDSFSAYYDAYDAIRLELLEQFEGQTKVFLTDNDTSVKRAFLRSVPSLCVFFGEARASDVILSHLNTYLNDPDWLLKCAFFKTIVGIAVYIGGASLEDFILPLMLQALTDPQEFVVEQALRSLASMAELGLIQRSKTWELVDAVARFQLHPNIWIKEAASHFIAASGTYLSVGDVRLLMTPLVQPYLKVPVGDLSESGLLDALKKPLPRSVLDLTLAWAAKAEKGHFWKSAKEWRQLSYRAVNQMPPTSSVAELNSRTLARIPKTDEDTQWLGRLRNAGMRDEDEITLLALREYVWRTSQRVKRNESNFTDQIYDSIISLTKLKVTPETVIFDSSYETWEQRTLGQTDRTITEALEEATSPGNETPFKPLELNGLPEVPLHQRASFEGITNAINVPQARPAGIQKRASGSLSSSPSSGVALLGRDGPLGRHKGSGAGLISGDELRKKTRAEVATDGVTAAGRVHTPRMGSRRNSPAPSSSRRRTGLERAGSQRKVHNYAGNDATVLKLLDAIYVNNFPVDVAEFGPLIQSTRQGPVSPNSISSSTRQLWRPQGLLVAVLSEHAEEITQVAVSPDHLFFVTASEDGTVKVWDTARLERNVTHRSRQTYRLATGTKVTSLCFIESTHSFVCTGSDGSVHVVKVEAFEATNVVKYGKLRVVREWQIPANSTLDEYAVWCEHFRSDSASTLLLATNLNRVLAIDLHYMNIIYELRMKAQHGQPTCFCLGRRSDWLLVGTTQGVLELWDLRFLLRLRSWTFLNPVPITRIQLHPSRKSARRTRVCVSGGVDCGEVTVWDIDKAICHEAYRPSCVKVGDPPDPRRYELRTLDDDHPETPLTKVTVAGIPDLGAFSSASDASYNGTAMVFGLHPQSESSEHPPAFAITGGPDGKVRFWDCDRLDGCRLVSGGPPDEKPAYTFVQTHNTETRILAEKTPEPAQPGATGIESSRVQPNTAAKRGAGGSSAPKPTRYDAIRASAQNLMTEHLDAITDVALLERPFGMILSVDRSGRVFVHQ